MRFLCVLFPQSVLCDVLKRKTLLVHAPKPPIARNSGDCEQTWRERGTSGNGGFGVVKKLRQTRALENKGQLWPMLCCIIMRVFV